MRKLLDRIARNNRKCDSQLILVKQHVHKSLGLRLQFNMILCVFGVIDFGNVHFGLV